MKLANVNVDSIQVFVIINKDRIKIKADVYVVYVIKEYVIKDFFGIPVIVTVHVINHVMLENIWVIKIVNVKKKSW